MFTKWLMFGLASANVLIVAMMWSSLEALADEIAAFKRYTAI